MADDTRQPPVGIPGQTSGRPLYEASPSFKLHHIVTGYGQPKLYDEVATQWPAVAQELDDMRSALASLDVQTLACGARKVGDDGDESAEERLWNDALEELLFGKLRIETADGYEEGLPSWLGWLVYPACWGAGFASPYWEHAGGLQGGAKLYVRPLELSAVDRFEAGRGDATPERFWYRPTSVPAVQIEYADVVHVTTVGSRPGHWYGWNPVFRSLTSTFVQWRSLVLQKAASYMTAGGVMTVEEDPAGGSIVDAAVRTEMLARLRELEDGQARSIIMPKGLKLSVLSPSGSMPDWRKEEEGLIARVKERFSNAAATLGLSTHGSRAVADEMGDEDRKKAARRRNALVNRGWVRLAQWVARQEGYTGRIRTLTTVEEDAGIDLATVPAIVQAQQAGLIQWTEQDAAWLRKGLGLPEAEEQQPAGRPPSGADKARIASALPAVREAAGIQASERECCGHHGPSTSLSDDDDDTEAGRFLIGSPGAEKEHYRPALTISIHGTEIRPELYHAWADEDDQRHTLDVTVTQQIEEIADEHRRAVWQTLELMTPEEYRPDHPDLVAVYDDYQTRYAALIDGYVERVRQSAYRQAESTAKRQTDAVNPGTRHDLDVDAIQRAANEAAERARNVGRVAAETTANRVQAEVEQSWNSGILPAGFRSRISANGLAQQARQAANAAEAAAGLEAATNDATTPRGWRIVALVRTSMMDGKVCPNCRDEDGVTFIESEDGTLVSTWGLPWADYPSLPDSRSVDDGGCYGGGNCRCRLLPVYGR